jgi:hypothetical protein
MTEIKQSDRPCSDLPSELVEGLADHAAHIVFEANEADGSRISIVEIEGDRCTVIVHEAPTADPMSRTPTTLVLPLESIVDMAQALDSWVRAKQSVR